MGEIEMLELVACFVAISSLILILIREFFTRQDSN